MLSKNTPELVSNGDEVHLFIESTLALRLPVILGPNIIGTALSPNIKADGCMIHYDDVSGTHHAIVSDTISAYLLYSKFGFNASLSNTIYSNSKTVQPRSLVFNYVIKY